MILNHIQIDLVTQPRFPNYSESRLTDLLIRNKPGYPSLPMTGQESKVVIVNLFTHFQGVLITH